MRGSIIPRGKGTYMLRISLGYDETTGKRRYKHKTVHGTKKEAEKALRELIARHEGGTLVAKDDRSSLNLLLEQWLRLHKEGEVSEITLEIYGDTIRRYIAPHIGGLPLFRITAADIRELYLNLRSQGLGATVMRFVHTVLRQAFAVAVEEGRIATNPAIGVKKPKRARQQKEKLVRAFSPEQAQGFMEASKRSRWRMLWKTALLSGMRPSEYLGLTWNHIDWDGCQISVVRNMIKVRREKTARFGSTKTKESRRLIAMPEEFMAELKAYRDGDYRLMREFAGDYWRDNGLVFPGRTGGFLCRENMGRRFKTVLRHAELSEDFNLYSMRHSMATLLLQLDENVKVVSERLGHANIVQTLKTYSHVLPSMQKRAAAKLGAMFYAEVA